MQAKNVWPFHENIIWVGIWIIKKKLFKFMKLKIQIIQIKKYIIIKLGEIDLIFFIKNKIINMRKFCGLKWYPAFGMYTWPGFGSIAPAAYRRQPFFIIVCLREHKSVYKSKSMNIFYLGLYQALHIYNRLAETDKSKVFFIELCLGTIFLRNMYIYILCTSMYIKSITI